MELRMRPLVLLLATFFMLGNVVACFDDDDDDGGVVVQPFTLTQPITQSNVNAAVGVEFTFSDLSSVHPSLSGQTTVSFPTGSSIQFQNGGNTASGNVTFGSCIVTLTNSTISGLSNGTQITINPCTITVETLNQIEVGGSGAGSVSVTLGNSNSSSQTTTITVSSGGNVTVNGQTVGQVGSGGTVTGTTSGN